MILIMELHDRKYPKCTVLTVSKLPDAQFIDQIQGNLNLHIPIVRSIQDIQFLDYITKRY